MQFQIIFKLNQLLLLLLFLEVNAQGIKATKNEGASFCLKLKKNNVILIIKCISILFPVDLQPGVLSLKVPITFQTRKAVVCIPDQRSIIF